MLHECHSRLPHGSSHRKSYGDSEVTLSQLGDTREGFLEEVLCGTSNYPPHTHTPTPTHKTINRQTHSKQWIQSRQRKQAERAWLLPRLPGSYEERGRDIEVASQDWGRTVWKQINVTSSWSLKTSNVPSKTTASL